MSKVIDKEMPTAKSVRRQHIKDKFNNTRNRVNAGLNANIFGSLLLILMCLSVISLLAFENSKVFYFSDFINFATDSNMPTIDLRLDKNNTKR